MIFLSAVEHFKLLSVLNLFIISALDEIGMKKVLELKVMIMTRVFCVNNILIICLSLLKSKAT